MAPGGSEAGMDIVEQALKMLTPERVARIRQAAAARLRGLTIVFDGLHDPHNVSAVLRSCEALGVQDAHLVAGVRSVDLSRGVTRGCERWLTLHWHEDAAHCTKALHAKGFRLLLAMPGPASQPLEDVDFRQKTALVFGNEHAGVSSEFIDAADGAYHIAMFGFVQSFNVSVAAAISLAHAARARRQAVGGLTDMTPEEQADLLQRWLKRELAMRPGAGTREHAPSEGR